MFRPFVPTIPTTNTTCCQCLKVCTALNFNPKGQGYCRSCWKYYQNVVLQERECTLCQKTLPIETFDFTNGKESTRRKQCRPCRLLARTKLRAQRIIQAAGPSSFKPSVESPDSPLDEPEISPPVQEPKRARRELSEPPHPDEAETEPEIPVEPTSTWAPQPTPVWMTPPPEYLIQILHARVSQLEGLSQYQAAAYAQVLRSNQMLESRVALLEQRLDSLTDTQL